MTSKDKDLKIVYVKDTKTWFDLHFLCDLKLETVISRLQKSNSKYNDATEAMKFVSGLQALGVSSSELEELKAKHKKVKTSDITPASVYSELNSLLPFKFNTSPTGQRGTYYLKGRTATLMQGDADEQLMSAIQSDKELFTRIKELYSNSSLVQKSKGALNFTSYMTKAFAEMRVDNGNWIEQPKLISWDPNEIAYCHFDISYLEEGKTPTWDEFLKRLDFPEIFMAWVWTIFSENNNSRQIMWLVGQGNDGKSVVMNVIKKILGEQYVAAADASNLNTNWFFSQVHGKRLTLFSDCSDPNIVGHPKMKQLTGDDNVPVEYKGENSFLAQVYTKVLVSSNTDVMPKIDLLDDSQTSRLIKIDVAPTTDRDTTFQYRLLQEKNYFLHRCKEMAEKHLNPKTGRIDLPQTLIDKMETSCASSDYLLINMFIQNHLEFGPEYTIDVPKLSRMFTEFLRTNYMGINRKNELMAKLMARQQKLGFKEMSGGSSFYIKGMRAKVVPI